MKALGIQSMKMNTNPFEMLNTEEAQFLQQLNSLFKIQQFLDELRTTLKTASKPPTKKYGYPMTASQEIGWFASARPQVSVK